MANVVEANNMDEILPNLWVGDLYSARNTELLRSKNVYSVLTAMRGRVSINETFMKHQINLDDTEEADVLQHLLPSISFIQAELDKGRGVLVHCQAGMSRSATIVAAYLMYSQNIDAATAIDMIRKARPSVQPNDGFMHQLEIFHQAAFKVSRRDKAVRMFYLERAVEEILNGDGSAPETDMFAKFPRTPSDSAPATPGGPRRRIRCKMCRQELAAREHMLDHGQIGPPTPAGVLSPATSRRASMNGRPSRRPSATGSRRPSAGASVQTRPRVGSGAGSDTRPRRPSLLSFEGSVLGGMAASLSMSALETEDENDSEGVKSEKEATAARRTRTPSRGASGSDLKPQRLSGPQNINSLGAFAAALSMSALDSEDEDSDVARPMRLTLPEPHTATKTSAEAPAAAAAEGAAASHPPPASAGTSPIADTIPEHAAVPSQPARASNGHVPSASPNGYQHPSDLAAQLYANPKLAALRGPMPLGMSPLVQPARDKASLSPPILMNPKCSGYFVEPMGWMEFFLEKGDLAGKIICPNKKCGAKLGNYDWAGVCCSCKEWVVPGFCIHRSKVDEIVV